jgi:hypothetical protein
MGKDVEAFLILQGDTPIADIAALRVRVEANIDPLRRGFAEANNEVQGFGGKIKGGLDNITRQFGMTGAMMSAAISAPLVAVAQCPCVAPEHYVSVVFLAGCRGNTSVHSRQILENKVY